MGRHWGAATHVQINPVPCAPS